MTEMEQWTTLQYLQAGAYIAIMLAVLGVPQMLSSYFDLRARRQAEERLLEERQEERRREEEWRHRQEEERRREEERRYHQEEERRREEERRYRQEEERHRQEEEWRRQDSEMAERRHQELMAALIAVLSSSRGQDNGQSELIRTLQQTIEDLRAENERLRQRNGAGDSTQSS